MQVHADTITFTCIGEAHTIPGTMSGQLSYHDATHDSTLECQM